MRRNLVLITMLIALCLFVGKANAAFIVDTGDPTGDSVWLLDSTEWLAGEFLLSAEHTITDIKGYLQCLVGDTVYAAIYSDGGDTPGSRLFSQDFSVQAGPFDNWVGPSGLSWFLSPGTYWVAFEVRAGSDFLGGMRADSPNPLGNEAAYDADATVPFWFAYDEADIGVKIQGNPIPIPSAVWLLGSGLLGIVGIRRKFET